jgi:hypothetical protein
MKTNEDAKQLCDSHGDSYKTGFYLRKYEFLSTDDIEPTDPVTSRKRNTQKLDMCYYYISTELDLSQKTFKDSVAKKHYMENECWINTLYDFYGDNLLSPDKKRNVITRDIILETLGRTEDNIKEGLSISEILPFFVKYRLQLRVFDSFYKLIYQYDPPIRNHHNKVLYCMMKDDHIYTLNHNINKPNQRLANNRPDNDNIHELNQHNANYKTNNNSDDVEDDYIEDIVIKPSSNYRVDEDRGPNYYKMIHHIDDLPTLIDNFLVYRCVLMLKEVFCDNTVILDIKQDIMHLIYNSDDLNSLFFQLKTAGY